MNISGQSKYLGAMAWSRAAVRAACRLGALVALCVAAAAAQANLGELRLQVHDPSGLGVQTAVSLTSEGSQYKSVLSTDESGELDVKRLPFGTYQIQVKQPGFAPLTQAVDIRSALPSELTVTLTVAAASTQVTVMAHGTLIDPDQAGAVNEVGSSTIDTSLASLPGRSLQDLVNSQPGWLYEGNAVLHPRGSEYQTQFVIDGIPLEDNRSPSFGPELEANDVDSMAVYTAGFPAEYGRKLGGVVEVNTLHNTDPGFHGQAALSGGSYDTAGAYLEGQYVWGKNTLGGSAGGNGTAHYLNPVVPQNYTNRGTTGDFALHYERDFTPNDRLTMSVRHELARFEIPNEQVQQAAGQLDTADNFETMGIASYQHIFSARTVAEFRTMVRQTANDYESNAAATPLGITQHNWFREAYFRATVTTTRGRHEWKAGIDSENNFLNENLAYVVTDPTRFGDNTPCTTGSLDDPAADGPCAFGFAGNRPDLEQAAFVQDTYRAVNWTINAGLRWDHYQLILNRQAAAPRFSIARYFPSAGLMLHFSYDRVFQTPTAQNLLLSSSPEVASSIPSSDFLRLPVEPSEGNYYEGGLTKTFLGKFRLDANYYRRLVDNTADDDQIANTTISFPIAFSKQATYGAEGKLELTRWGKFSGFVSYSYQVGNIWFPVTGGLFLGGNAQSAQTQLSGHFPDTQDQRNFARGRVRYQVLPRLWVAGGAQYDSGLPFEFDGDPQTVLDQYGQRVLNRINFDRGRIRPTTLLSASLGADLYGTDKFRVHFQADGENLTNVLDVIDFGGLFSGNAIGPGRSFSLRLEADF